MVLDGRVGGRIYERTPDGREVDWGECGWEPPHRLAYLWHIRRDRADATDVALTFVHRGPLGTRLEIDHRGWSGSARTVGAGATRTPAAGPGCCRTSPRTR